ncbi:hypothetical protein EMIT0196P_50074 [Pseudomonas chlororaphis]
MVDDRPQPDNNKSQDGPSMSDKVSIHLPGDPVAPAARAPIYPAARRPRLAGADQAAVFPGVPHE